MSVLPAFAQTVPDAGALLKENERRMPPALPAPAISQEKAQDTTVLPEGPAVTPRAFRLTGATLIPDAELQALLQPYVGQPQRFADLERLTVLIADEYRRRGWLARVILPQQDIVGGVVALEIVESRLGKVRVENGGMALRMDLGMASKAMTARQQPGEALRLDDVERATNILNDTPGVVAAAVLAPGQSAGETDVVLKLQDKPLFAASTQTDNQGSRSTGQLRLSTTLSLDNPGGRGDQASLHASAAAGSQYMSLAYSTALNEDGLRGGINASYMQYRLQREFATSGTHGDAQSLGLMLSYPLIRSNSRNLNVVFSLDSKRFRNDANVGVLSRKAVQTGTLTANWDATDTLGGGGLVLGGINVTVGKLDLGSDADSRKADLDGPQTDGDYRKFAWNLARLQRLSDRASLWMSAAGQFADKNLDSSEKMSLGGPFGVRAYPLLEGTGDDGWHGSLELRYTLSPEWMASAFYDYGNVRVNHTSWGNPTLDRVALDGVGLGLQWSRPGSHAVRATVARRLGSNPGRDSKSGRDADGSLDLYRLWLNAVVFF